MTYYYVRTSTQDSDFMGTIEVSHGTGEGYLYASHQIPPQKQWLVDSNDSLSQYLPSEQNQLSGGNRDADDWEVEFKPTSSVFTATVTGISTWKRVPKKVA